MEEDDYIRLFGDVIERDYYPDLKKHRLQYELNDARSKNDVQRVQYLRSNYQNLTAVDDTVSSMSIDDFLSRYTSEDNASFDVIHQNDLLLHRQKYHWLHDDEDKDKRKGMLMLYYINKDITLTGKQRQRIDKLLLTNDGSSVDARPAAPKSWDFTVRNSLMFPPNTDDVAQHVCSVNKMITNGCSSNCNNLLVSPSTSDAVIAMNTRIIPDTISNSTAAGATATFNSTNTSTYEYVPMTPSQQEISLSFKPIMTYGTIVGPPIILSAATDFIDDSCSYMEPYIDTRNATINTSSSSNSNAINTASSHFVIKPYSNRDALKLSLSRTSLAAMERPQPTNSNGNRNSSRGSSRYSTTASSGRKHDRKHDKSNKNAVLKPAAMQLARSLMTANADTIGLKRSYDKN